MRPSWEVRLLRRDVPFQSVSPELYFVPDLLRGEDGQEEEDKEK